MVCAGAERRAPKGRAAIAGRRASARIDAEVGAAAGDLAALRRGLAAAGRSARAMYDHLRLLVQAFEQALDRLAAPPAQVGGAYCREGRCAQERERGKGERKSFHDAVSRSRKRV